MLIVIDDIWVIECLRGDVGEGTTIATAQITKGSDITAVGLAASALEEAFMYSGVVPQVQPYHTVLIFRSIKVGRKSASGAVRRYFGGERCTTSSAANASDIGACKSWKSGERLACLVLGKDHKTPHVQDAGNSGTNERRPVAL